MSDKLDKFFDAIADIPDKNRGGCLFFCYAFLKWGLSEDIDMSTFAIVQYASTKGKVINNQNYFDGLDLHSYASNHFTWMLNDIEYDGDASTCHDELEGLFRHEFHRDIHELEQFCISALTYDLWNSTFDRYEAIEVIEENLGLDLTEVQ